MSLSSELLFHLLLVRMALNLIWASVLSEVFGWWKLSLWDFLDPYLQSIFTSGRMLLRSATCKTFQYENTLIVVAYVLGFDEA